MLLPPVETDDELVETTGKCPRAGDGHGPSSCPCAGSNRVHYVGGTG